MLLQQCVKVIVDQILILTIKITEKRNHNILRNQIPHHLYTLALFHWHCKTRAIVLVSVNQSWRILINSPHEFEKNYAGIIQGMSSTNKRRRYNVTSSFFGWVHTQNDLCCVIIWVLFDTLNFNDVTRKASQIPRTPLFIQQLVLVNNSKENTKASHTDPLWGESTSEQRASNVASVSMSWHHQGINVGHTATFTRCMD